MAKKITQKMQEKSQEQIEVTEEPKKEVVFKKPVKKLYRFYGFYNNISIGPKIHLNNVKIIMHEVFAINLDEAVELYKLHLIHKVGISEANIEQYLIDLYYKKIYVEIIDSSGIESAEIGLVA